MALGMDGAPDIGKLDTSVITTDVGAVLIAAAETTANALAWSFELLALNPSEQERIRAEALSVLGADRLPEADDVPKLQAARRAFAEALRLYPPSWYVTRRALIDTNVDGHATSAGTLVLTSPYLVHRDPRHHAKPDQFAPDRWSDEIETRPRSAFYPFGGGPRQCLGERLAWLQGAITLSVAARRWRLSSVPGCTATPRFGASLEPHPGVRLRVDDW
jgi:cytochrome P450